MSYNSGSVETFNLVLERVNLAWRNTQACPDYYRRKENKTDPSGLILCIRLIDYWDISIVLVCENDDACEKTVGGVALIVYGVKPNVNRCAV